jgi:hypothetical protein
MQEKTDNIRPTQELTRQCRIVPQLLKATIATAATSTSVKLAASSSPPPPLQDVENDATDARFLGAVPLRAEFREVAPHHPLVTLVVHAQDDPALGAVVVVVVVVVLFVFVDDAWEPGALLLQLPLLQIHAHQVKIGLVEVDVEQRRRARRAAAQVRRTAAGVDVAGGEVPGYGAVDAYLGIVGEEVANATSDEGMAGSAKGWISPVVVVVVVIIVFVIVAVIVIVVVIAVACVALRRHRRGGRLLLRPPPPAHAR